MAVDTALLLGDGGPALRVYGWDPPGMSLGYFQEVIAPERVPSGYVVVRRPTGGGAIPHDREEVTFSLAGPVTEPFLSGGIRDLYRRTAERLSAACASLGVMARLRGPSGRASRPEHEHFLCFERANPFDLIDAVSGSKIGGMAQRRTRGRVLLHGALQIRCGAGPVFERDRLVDALVESVKSAVGTLALDAAPPEHETAARLEESFRDARREAVLAAIRDLDMDRGSRSP